MWQPNAPASASIVHSAGNTFEVENVYKPVPTAEPTSIAENPRYQGINSAKFTVVRRLPETSTEKAGAS